VLRIGALPLAGIGRQGWLVEQMGVSGDDNGVRTDDAITMRNTLGRVVVFLAEMLDRSLLTVPDLDLDEVYTPPMTARRDRLTPVAN
jgi:hypothetical protein